MANRPLFYVGFRTPLWPEVQRRSTADPAVVLYLTPGGRWDQLGFAPKLTHTHSPGGFAWGYGGSGPAELARHLLWHATGRRDLLERPDLYQEFKRDVLVDLGPQWLLSGDMIRTWVEQHNRPPVQPGEPFVAEAGAAYEDGHGERRGAGALQRVAGGGS